MESKICSRCSLTKLVGEYYRTNTYCRECANAIQRLTRAKNNNKITKTYEKTHKGFIMRMYRNMESRVTGIQKKCSHLYKGLPLIEREEFYAWINSQPSFFVLFDEYVKSDYDRKISPTIDRIDSKQGYTIGNIQVLTLSDNCKRVSIYTDKDKELILNLLGKGETITGIYRTYFPNKNINGFRELCRRIKNNPNIKP